MESSADRKRREVRGTGLKRGSLGDTPVVSKKETGGEKKEELPPE